MVVKKWGYCCVVNINKLLSNTPLRNMSMKMRHVSQTFSVSVHHLPVTAY